MLENIMEALLAFSHSVRIQDVFDVIIISTFIYGFLIWFKSTTSRLVLVGISLFGVVYIVARWFHLYLTSMALKSFFTILIIALVVIFQEEIRRFFERVASWGSIKKSISARDEAQYLKDIRMVIESVADFASNRTGALIVLKGNDPLERHLEGGYALDGILSHPLLASIFDAHSMGHDGAVIIDEGQVQKFGCHLPLSLNPEKFGRFGLRHTAALGLAERCDSLCIVVSEERGSISIAHNGRIGVIGGVPRLGSILEDFYEKKYPAKKQKAGTQWFRRNMPEKAVAIFLAIGLWFAFGYQKESVQRDFVVPIEYRMESQEWEIEESKAKEASITLVGSPQAFSIFDPTTLKISVDLSSIKEGWQRIVLNEEMVKVPSNLYMVKINPEKIHIVAHKKKPEKKS
jgi:uncharacterized protein (TIGR00159 family)